MDSWNGINPSNRRYSEEELREIQERYLVKQIEARCGSCIGEGRLGLEGAPVAAD